VSVVAELVLRQTKAARGVNLERWYKPMMLGLAILIGGFGALVSAAQFGAFASRGLVGIDFDTFLVYARRFLDTGSMYLPYQLAGPFNPQPLPHIPAIMPSMYPPIAVFLFVPFLVLPSILWWIIPLSLTGVIIASWRPAPWSWPVMALVSVSPNLGGFLAAGGTNMWVVLFVTAGLRYGWPAALIAIKPTFLPFMFVGAGRRAFWPALGLMVALSLVMLPETLRYVTVVLNSRGAGLLYSVGDIPFVLVPIVAWLSRSRSWSHAA
jgi:hypothetical protein